MQFMTAEYPQKILLLSSCVTRDLKTLAKFAEQDTHVHFDFEILSANTILFDKKTNERIDMTDFIDTNPNHTITQQYTVEVFLKTKNYKEPAIKLISGHKDYFSVDALFSLDNYQFDVRSVEKDLIRFLHKKKVKHGLLINIFEDEMLASVKQLSTAIANNKGYLGDEVRIPVLRATKQEDGVEATVEIVATVGESDQKNGILHLQAIAGSVLLISRQGKRGFHGRKGNGHAVIANIVDDIAPKIIKSYGSIEIQPHEDGFAYIAMENGHAIFDGATLHLGNLLEQKEVSFRNTGNILLPESNLKISSNSNYQDAVTKALVTGNSIDIEGAVGEDGVLRGDIVNLNGQSNKYSRIYAKKATLKYHKGSVEAEEVVIETLEPGGKVTAKIARIDISLGGIVRADYIYIKELRGENHLFAAKKIFIGKVINDGNCLTIENGIPQNEIYTVDEIKTKKIQITNKLASEKSRKASAETYLKTNSITIKEVEKHIAESVQKKTNPDQRKKIIFDQIQERRKNIVEAKKNIESLNSQELELMDKLEYIKRAIFDAEIVIEETGIDTMLNKVVFLSAIPQKEITFKAISRPVKRFYLDYLYQLQGEE